MCKISSQLAMLKGECDGVEIDLIQFPNAVAVTKEELLLDHLGQPHSKP